MRTTRRQVNNIREARQCLKDRLTPDKRRILRDLREGLVDYEIGHLRETLGTDTFDAVALDASHNSLVAGYGQVPPQWRAISRVVTTQDFKPVNASALSGLADMPIVNESQDYLEVDQLDERVTYTPQKRGGLLRISMEARARIAPSPSAR